VLCFVLCCVVLCCVVFCIVLCCVLYCVVLRCVLCFVLYCVVFCIVFVLCAGMWIWTSCKTNSALGVHGSLLTGTSISYVHV